MFLTWQNITLLPDKRSLRQPKQIHFTTQIVRLTIRKVRKFPKFDVKQNKLDYTTEHGSRKEVNSSEYDK